jgi:hypothetical protein
MKSLIKTLALMFVFFALTPGVLIRLPIKGGVNKIAFIHAVLFGAIYFIVTNVFGVLKEGLTTCKGSNSGKLTGCKLAKNNNCDKDNIGKCNSLLSAKCNEIKKFELVSTDSKGGAFDRNNCTYTGINNASECANETSCNKNKTKICSKNPSSYDWTCFT